LTTIKGFYDYTEEELRGGIANGTYHMRVTESEADTWDDGRPRLNIRTEVASGDNAGAYGPRHTWSLGSYSGVTGEGREFTITEETNQKKLINNIMSIMNGRTPVVTNPTSWDMALLEELSTQLVDEEFVCTISSGKNGYQKVDKFYAMSSPPNGFKLSRTEVKAFNV